MGGDYFVANISADSLAWTHHWLKDRRCDLLCVAIARAAAVSPRIRITAVESKSNTGEEPIQIRAEQEPFAEGVGQVVATLQALSAFLDPAEGQTLVADLKLSSLFEHLASEILAQIAPIQPAEVDKLFVLEALSALSKRELVIGHQLVLDGLVVVTQRDVNVPTIHTDIEVDAGDRKWPVRLIRCGIPALREMFEEAGLSELPIIGAQSTAPPKQSGAGVPDRTSEVSSVETGVDAGHEQHVSVRAAPVSHSTVELLERLEAACRLRRFPIDSIDPDLAQEGPTLVSVPVALQAGEKLAPIVQATGDLARELGVPSVVVENDPTRPYHIRFLLPRSDRQFPPIPADPPSPEGEHYLPMWIGAQVDGTPFKSHVSEWPHLLVAGTTGSGKTTFLRSVLLREAAY